MAGQNQNPLPPGGVRGGQSSSLNEASGLKERITRPFIPSRREGSRFLHAARDAFFAAVIALLLFFHLIGLRTVDNPTGLTIQPQWWMLGLAVAGVFVGRLLIGIYQQTHSHIKLPAFNVPYKRYSQIMAALLVIAVILPLTPLSSRYVLDVMTLIFTYLILASALNMVVGLTGLLDLGFVAYYAIGAYCFALLARYTGLDFWVALPAAMLSAALISGVLGMAVLRLRGDYYAVVTLGFAEILRIVLLNWVSFTGGPNGLTGVPRPGLFGLSFDRVAPPGMQSFYDFFHLSFEPMTRITFLYYLALLLAALCYLFVKRLRSLPLGRAFEAVRDDEIAAGMLGMHVTRIKLAATMLAAAMGALAGAFFAARQGFISPESFTFSESVLVLAIVVLAGHGHMLGLAIATLFLVGLPEIFRSLQDYRLIAFGLGMIIVMILRPSGFFATRAPMVLLTPKKE